MTVFTILSYAALVSLLVLKIVYKVSLLWRCSKASLNLYVWAP